MASNLSILIVTGEYPPMAGGVGDYTALLSGHLTRLGARVAVLTRGSEGGSSTLGDRCPPVLRAVRSWGPGSWLQVAAAASRCEARVVHLQYQAAAYAMSPAVNLLPGYLRARLRSVKVVTTFHDLRVPYLFPRAGPLRQNAVRALDALSHGSVMASQADLDDLGGDGAAGRGGRPRRWLIPIGSNLACAPPPDFDRAAWRRQLGADDDTLLLSYFGFMNDSKGVEFLVQALGLLEGRGVKLRLLIVGGEAGETDRTNSTYSHRIQQLIQSRRLEGRVFWTGFLAPEEVSASLLSSDLCALPFRDGASLRRGSLLAAVAHGLPIVTTFPDPPEPLLRDGENVVMVKRDSPADLAGAIEGLWRNPEARSCLSAGTALLAPRFAWPEIARRHLEMYAEVMGGK